MERDVLDKVAAHLRDISPGYHLAKAEYEGMREVKYFDLFRNTIETAKPKDVLAKTARYVSSIAKGAANCLAEDTFFIDYDLRSNLLGKVAYGEIHCMELSFKVDWVVKKVVASFYTGEGRAVYTPDDLKKVLWEGKVRDLANFAAMTCLDEDHVGPSEGQRLLSILQCSAYVQSKLTRLVKGCLIYVDHLDSGAKTYSSGEIPTLNYNVTELLSTMDFSNTAYVHTKHEMDSAYSLILYAMCQEYPSPLFGGVDHVKIPADGDVIYLVGYSPLKRYENVVVTPKLVMGTLIEYSDQFWLGEELESAMMIVCSLRQNRYLEEVGLPAVLSNCDLMYPALSGNKAGGGLGVRGKTRVSKEEAVMLGRFHQMACLVLFKDFDTSFRNTLERNRNISSLFGMHEWRLIECMEDQMSSGILKISKSLIWLRFLNDEAMARLRKYSVFEGFWLVKKNPVKVLKDGIIKCLKGGVKNQSYSWWYEQASRGGIDKTVRYISNGFDVLKEEVNLGGGGDSELTFSDGAFNVGLGCIRTESSEQSRVLSFEHESTWYFDFD